jgi:streptogramin lyase
MLGGMVGIVLSVVAVQQFGPGPGDPTTVYASGFGGGPMGMAASLSGELYVTDHARNQIVRVAPDRSVTVFAAIERPGPSRSCSTASAICS